ncbi:hypothetical protein RMN57_33905 [Kitasatospora sp. CM 4170]|uniref:Uncharacterized protein n=1 Tax=Kitasatospora aburaviensis TaxID=67265 RepID=A0ABW1F3I3_9ACTN|nr:hypothetical protein [Kitasatospora sp. CM 4170]WNM49333.1 hypothetical protein RMN57_33905 [Kitasatospora sp. CM 4170]
MPSCPRMPAYAPKVGEVVRDLAHRNATGAPTEGVYMDTLNGLAYLRPEPGGCEWTTGPEYVQRLERPRYLVVQHPSRPRANDTVA